MNKKDRRRYKRLAIKMPISWRSEGEKKSNLADAFLFDIRNITPSGLFVRTSVKPKKSSRLELIININRKGKPIILKGKVVWIASKKKHPYLYPGIGIAFEHIPRDEYKKLNTFIKDKLINFRDARKLKDMYIKLKNMASRLVELEERHSSAIHFRKVIDNAINEIDDVAHILDREINEIKKM